MNPLVLLGGFILFLGSLLTHVVMWRIRAPRNDVRMLFMIFLIVPSSAIFSTAFCNRVDLSSIIVFEVLLFYAALAGVYIASYPAAKSHSPSLAILLIISASPDKRLTGEEIVKRYMDRHTLGERVKDLGAYDLVPEKDGMLSLRPLAVMIIRLYIFYRKLLGLPPGEG